jgi:hypothetical protein
VRVRDLEGDDLRAACALTALTAAREFAGRACEVIIGIEQFDVTRKQIVAVLESVADNLRTDVSTGGSSL